MSKNMVNMVVLNGHVVVSSSIYMCSRLQNHTSSFAVGSTCIWMMMQLHALLNNHIHHILSNYPSSSYSIIILIRVIRTLWF